jgi:hypothetical protein
MSRTLSSKFSTVQLYFNAELDSRNKATTEPFTIETDVECWSVHCMLDKTSQYDKFSGFLNLNVFKTDNPSINATDAGFYMTSSAKIQRSPLMPGYAACRFPNSESIDKDQISGSWVCTLATNQWDFTNYPQIQLWLCKRRFSKPSGLLIDKYSLPTRFILIAPQAMITSYGGVFGYAIDRVKTNFKSIINNLPFSSTVYESVPSDILYKADMYSDDLSSLVNKYNQPVSGRFYFNVYVFWSLEIPVANAAGFCGIPTALGLNMLVNGCFVSARYSNGAPRQYDRLADIISHEMCHGLGLIHESACLDSETLSGSNDLCEKALTNQYDSEDITGNLMFTSASVGARLNKNQVYMIKNCAFVEHRISIPAGTKIIKCLVTLWTGDAFNILMSWFDGPGTDDDIYFSLKLRDPAGTRSRTPGVKVDTTGGKNFERNSCDTYSIAIPSGVYEEDVVGFIIRKGALELDNISFMGQSALKLSDNDWWYLERVQISINNRSWYDEYINQWLHNTDGTRTGRIDRDMTKPTGLLRLREDINNPQNVYVTNPFTSTPTTLNFKSSTYVTIKNWESLTVQNLCTLEVWVYPYNQNANTIMYVGTNGNNLGLSIEGGYYIFTRNNNILIRVKMSDKDVNKWIHLGVTYDGSTWILYRNGFIFNSVTNNMGFNGLSGDIIIGRGITDISTGFAGTIRDICIWNIVRSIDDISDDIELINPLETGLVAFWRLNEGDGSSAYDLSAGPNNTSNGIISDPEWNTTVIKTPNCIFSPSARSDRVEYITITNNPKIASGLKNQSITLMAWTLTSAYDTSVSTGEKVIIGFDNLVLRINDNKYQFTRVDLAGGVSVEIPKGDAGYWVHLCGTYDQKSRLWCIYRNGILLANSIATGISDLTPKSFYIGGRPGVLSRLGIYIRYAFIIGNAISMSNLRSIYIPYEYSNDKIITDKLIAYWSLDENIGREIYDESKIEPLANTQFLASTIVTRGYVSSVSTVNSIFVDPGKSIVTALATITNASQRNQYTVYIAPGIYNEILSIKPWIQLSGSGQNITSIIALGSTDKGVINMAENTVLRQLDVNNSALNLSKQ